jgi:hypothetical protein
MPPQTQMKRGRPRTSASSNVDVDPITGAKRAVIRLQLDLAAKQALDKLTERRGMTQIAALSRMVKWLVGQDEIMQAWVLGLMSEQHLGPMAELSLRSLAGKSSPQ